MSLEQTIDKFLETISEKSVETYSMKINIFYKFLVQEKGINNRSYGSYLEAMKIEEIEESLDYYINSNQIKSVSIALHYISVVKRYFNFIYKLGIENNNLIKSFGLSEEHSDSFQSRIREKIFNDPKLEIKDQKQEISLEEAEVLISECDQRVEELIEENTVLEYKEYASKYNDLMTSIIIKLMLYTGVTYRAIRNIEFESVNKIHNTICINSYIIHLPNKLSEQLDFYINIREKVQKDKKIFEDTLFISADGKKLSDKTALVSNTLRDFVGRGDLTGIIKFAVIQMISRGVNQSLIQDFTKVGNDIYRYCQNKVNKDKNLSASRYLDSKLRSLETFDML